MKTNTKELRKTYTMYYGQSMSANAVISLCDDVEELLDALKTVWDFFHPTPHKRIDRVDMLDEIYYILLSIDKIDKQDK